MQFMNCLTEAEETRLEPGGCSLNARTLRLSGIGRMSGVEVAYMRVFMNTSFMNMNSLDTAHRQHAILRNESCVEYLQSVQFNGRDSKQLLWRNASMPRVKQASKRKHVTKTVPVLGAAGLTFSLVGGASAAVAPIQDQPRTPNLAPGQEFTLGEEEISDVSLATFYVFDKENTGAARNGVQMAWGCGGCRGCRGCRACRGCAGCRCGVGCGGCCWSWGACRPC
jgi:hypothetical protein